MSAFSHLDIIVNNIQECIDRCRTRGVSEHFIAGLELAKRMILDEEDVLLKSSPTVQQEIESSLPCNHLIV